MRKLVNPNNYCPCGSNQKYKKCCQPKGIDYFIKPGGKIIREQPLTPEARQALERQKQEFATKYGRAVSEEEENLMRLNEFSNVNAVIEQDLLKAGASAETIYAFRKTGILVSKENINQVSPQELIAWESAIQEYRRSNPR
jgi:hypothetical protein